MEDRLDILERLLDNAKNLRAGFLGGTPPDYVVMLETLTEELRYLRKRTKELNKRLHKLQGGDGDG